MSSCNDDKKKAIELNDIYSDYEMDVEDNLEGAKVADSTSFVKKRFSANGIPISALSYSTESTFPDRFGATGSEKYKIVLEQDTLNYFKWAYADSAKVMNAFFNWIDCFGKNCDNHIFGDQSNMQKNSFLLLVGDSTMVFIEGIKVDFKNWYEYHESIAYVKGWNYSIEQRYRGKAKWYKFVDNKKILYDLSLQEWK